MFNEQRLQTIRGKIQTSTLLSDHEKSDWLNLLELMNDKQLGELEEILAAEQPTISPAPPVVPNLPPLSHIANIPTDVTMKHSVPPTKSVRPPQQPFPSTKPQVPLTPQAQVQPPAPVKPTVPVKPKPPLLLEDVELIGKFTIDTIRNYDLQTIVNAVRDAIAAHGYFHILQLVESSPLYESYIESGKQRLSPQANSSSLTNTALLTQEEFEFFTDLLRSMRFNRS